MYKLRIIKIIAVIIAVAGNVLTAGARIWDMDSCMTYAVEHSTSVEKKQWAAQESKAELQSSIGGFIPTVSSEVSAQYSWGRNIDPETNTYNTQATFNNYYRLYSSLTVFDGGRTLNGFLQARTKRQSGMADIEKAKEDKEIEVMQKYVDLVYARAGVLLAEDKLKDSRRLLEKTRRQEELGIKGRPDVVQIEAQVAEDDYNLTHQRNQSRTALLALKSSMNYPSSDSLETDASLVRIEPEYRLEQVEDIYEYASGNSTAARLAAFNVRTAMYDYRIMKGKLLPSISVFAGVSTNYYKNITTGSVVDRFNSQFSNNLGEYIGASITIPIFNYSYYGNVRKAHSAVHIAELEKEESMRKLHDDIENAVMDRNGYVKEILQMEHKVEADSLAYYVSERKYEEGMLSVTDLRAAADTLLESRITLLQMKMLYAMKDRLVDYYKGIGIIRNNNITRNNK
ncbi:MAG: TolC family protein [Bacteroidales bacterium]|jgi:outer membrane protein|nr:TolC family protein [Bacteroidales bacterium]MCI1784665.1 TolC family protein [Bacteroidales bacterium]